MSDTELHLTEMQIVASGAARVNHAHVVSRGDSVAAICIDTASKRCVVDSHGDNDGVPTVGIGCDEETLYVDHAHPRERATEVAFPEFTGWRVWSAMAGRYSIFVCLIRND